MDALFLLIALVAVLVFLSARLYSIRQEAPEEEDPSQKRLALVIDSDLIDVLSDRAKEERRSVGEVLNDLIRDSLRDRRDSGSSLP